MAAVVSGQEVREVKPVHDMDSALQSLVEDDEDDDNGVTEIESLCMNCHDDVSITDRVTVVRI